MERARDRIWAKGCGSLELPVASVNPLRFIPRFRFLIGAANIGLSGEGAPPFSQSLGISLHTALLPRISLLKAL